MKRNARILCVLLCFGLLSSTGCDFWNRLMNRKESAPAKPPAVKVEVMRPILREVVDYETFTGETEAVDNVKIQAQVAGILTKCNFTEGGSVTKDALLFEIEPEVYAAVLETARGNLASAEGELAAQQAREPQYRNERNRLAELLKSKAISESEFEDSQASYDECLAKIQKCEADILKARAEVHEAEIDLKYTRILSPIEGYISRKLVTEGNLIQPHATLLAQIVSLDPIYVNFYVDETTYLRLVDLAESRATDGDTKPDELKIEFRLTNETTFEDAEGQPLHTGSVKYTDPSMDQSSGTVLLRATCPNPKSANGLMNRIIPGMMVHIRIPVTETYQAVLVPEEALGTEQGTRYIYVVGADGTAQMRHLELGPLQEDNMRVVRKGVEAGDTLVVSGLLRLRPGSQVDAKETTLPALRKGIVD